jgi:adenine-specific DNA-methyltransferase
MRVVDKDISSQKKKSGQFLTPSKIVDFCLAKIELSCENIIEPSCGKGVFLDAARAISPNCKILGIELDKELANGYAGKEEVRLQNFYDFDEQISGSVAFIGNPPYRTPAVSLTSHNEYIKKLMKTYGVSGVKEEAVFFIVKTVDLIFKSKVNGEIHYILPKSIFQNNSTGYKTFVAFLKKHVKLLQVWDITEFPGVDQKLVFVSMRVLNDGDNTEENFMMNGRNTPVNKFYGNKTE